MQNTKEEIEAILVSMGLTNIAFNLPIKKQIDSLDLTALVIAVEDEWNISITDEDQYELRTFDDLIKLIHLKTRHMTTEKKPTIDDQIKFIKDFVLDPIMRDAIIENLLAIRYQESIRLAATTHEHAKYPLTNASGHSFSE